MGNSEECLLIDDDTDDQEIFLMCLKKVGEHINCSVANNGAEAISMLTSNQEYTPQYIFIDVNMPKMNGIECLKKIKSIERLKETKVFMYSTTSEKEVVLDSENLGAADFIVKPAKSQELKEKLARIFGIVSEINQGNKR